jgi:hypothetical protein
MSKSGGTTSQRGKRTTGAANPVAFALKNGQFRQRIVKSKVKYDRKRGHKGCDNLSHLF